LRGQENTLKRFFTYFSLSAVLLLSGCLIQANQQADADLLVKELHAAMQSGNWDAAMELYGKDFFAGHDKATWRGKMMALQERFGELREIKAGFSQKDPRFGGEFYIYGYKLFYEHGVLHETLTVFKGIDAERMVVTGQMFKFKDEVL